MRPRPVLLPTALSLALCGPYLPMASATPAISDPAPSAPETVVVEVLRDGSWVVVGELPFGRFPSEGSLTLPAAAADRSRVVRISRLGDTTAYLDLVRLGDRPPLAAPDDADAARLLADPDLDLWALPDHGSLTLELPADGEPTLRILARIAPRTQPVTPVTLPVDNLYLNPDSFRSFAVYTLVDGDRGLTSVDGVLEDELPGPPLFEETVRPGSGHPTAPTVVWAGNDRDTLYAAVDFLSDNTDEAEDFATLHVRTPEGLQSFTVSAGDRRWGASAFAPTRLAAYRHTTYELAVPLTELGLGTAPPGTPLELAFSLYGTVAVAPLIDHFAAPSPAGQSVDASACTLGLDDVATPSILGVERDMRVVSGTPVASVNIPTPGMLIADFSTSAGAIEIVYDGIDEDCTVVETATSIGDLFSPGYDRIVLVNAGNPESADLQVKLRLVTADPPVRAVSFESVVRTVPAGSGPANVPFLFASDFPTLGDPSLLGMTAAVVLEISAAAPGGVLTAEELVPSNGPVPVELQSFEVSDTN